MDILTILILLIHEHKFCVFYNFFFKSMSYDFPVYRYFTSLVKFISRHFILFDAAVNGVIFLIYLSDS